MTNLTQKKHFLVESIQMCHQSTFLFVCVRFNETWHQLQAGVCLPSLAQPCWSSFTLLSLGGSKEPVVGLCWTKEDAQIELSNQRSKGDPRLSTAHTVASWNEGWQRLDHLELRRPSETAPTPSGARSGAWLSVRASSPEPDDTCLHWDPQQNKRTESFGQSPF